MDLVLYSTQPVPKVALLWSSSPPRLRDSTCNLSVQRGRKETRMYSLFVHFSVPLLSDGQGCSLHSSVKKMDQSWTSVL